MTDHSTDRQSARIDDTWYRRPESAPVEVCAGGVVTRVDDGTGRVVVALAYHRGHRVGILPKGHREPGESLEAAAHREVEEEAGFSDLVLLGCLGRRDRLDYARQEWKEITYFLFYTRQAEGMPTEGETHPPPTWHDLDDLPPLFWPEQQELLETNRERIRRYAIAAAAAPPVTGSR